MRIVYYNSNEVFDYAASELKKYIVQMSRGKIYPDVEKILPGVNTASGDTIVFGLFDEVGVVYEL